MPGKKIDADQTYLTELLTYRSDITAADPTPDSDAIPEIRLDIDTTKLHYAATCPVGDPAYEVSSRAYNAHLELYVHFEPGETDCDIAGPGIIDGVLSNEDNRCHATIQVWAWGEPVDGSLEGHWCLAYEQSVVTDTLIPLRNIPNTKYKVTVAYMNGTGTVVDILEQHTV